MEPSIRLLTLNMFLRPPGIKTNSSDFKEIRTQVLVQRIIPEFDVVVLQEVFSTLNSRKGFIVGEARKAGLVYSQEGPAASLFSGSLTDSGLLVLSRYEIVDRDLITFEDSMGPDRLSAKGVIYVKIKTNASPINLFTTHLQSSYTTQSYSDFMKYRQIRRKQLVQLRKFIDIKVQNPNETVIIAGDLNVDGREHIKPPLFQVLIKQQPCQDDYSSLCEILSNNGRNQLVDLILLKYEEPLATFGVVDENGNPKEVVLTHADDCKLELCLDYIFFINAEVRER